MVIEFNLFQTLLANIAWIHMKLWRLYCGPSSQHGFVAQFVSDADLLFAIVSPMSVGALAD